MAEMMKSKFKHNINEYFEVLKNMDLGQSNRAMSSRDNIRIEQDSRGEVN